MVLRNFQNRWVYWTILLTIIGLWIGLGTESYWVLRGAEMDVIPLVEKALTSDGQSLVLPFLSALPGAAAVRKEMQSGAIRNILFRKSMKWYIWTRIINLLLITIMTQGIGMLLFLVILAVCTGHFYIGCGFMLGRLMAAVFFGIVGSIGALLTQDTICAYAVPVAVGYAANMIRARFWFDAYWLDPMYWLSGNPNILFTASIIVFISVVIYGMYLRWEVQRNV